MQARSPFSVSRNFDLSPLTFSLILSVESIGGALFDPTFFLHLYSSVTPCLLCALCGLIFTEKPTMELDNYLHGHSLIRRKSQSMRLP